MVEKKYKLREKEEDDTSEGFVEEFKSRLTAESLVSIMIAVLFSLIFYQIISSFVEAISEWLITGIWILPFESILMFMLTLVIIFTLTLLTYFVMKKAKSHFAR